MKKVISTLMIFIVLILGVSVMAEEIEFIDIYTAGNIEYYWKDNVLYLQGKGEMTDFSHMFTDDELPDSPFWKFSKIKKVIIKDGFTDIGRSLFKNSPVEEVVIPKSVRKIDEYAFYGCSNLKKVTFEGEGLEHIGNYAFLGCVKLEKINIPDSVKNIDSAAFHACYSLKEIIIGDNIEYVYPNAFEYCTNAESIYIGKSMKDYPQNFVELKSLKTITVSEENMFYTVIDNVLFSKDKKELIKFPPKSEKSEYRVPDYVTRISQNAFDDCTGLKVVRLPENIDPDKLLAPETLRFESENINNGYTAIEYMGDFIYYETGENEHGKWLRIKKVSDNNSDKKFLIPEEFNFLNITIDPTVYTHDMIECVDAGNLTKISPWLFRQSKVQKVILSEDLKVIDQCAFEGCTNLREIVIPEGVERIEWCAFTYSGLLEVTIPKSVNYIGGKAFEGCKALEKIVICEGELKKLGNDYPENVQCFNNIGDNVQIYLPESLETINENEFRCFIYGVHGGIGWQDKYPENMNIYTKKGSCSEAWAIEKGFNPKEWEN